MAARTKRSYDYIDFSNDCSAGAFCENVAGVGRVVAFDKANPAAAETVLGQHGIRNLQAEAQAVERMCGKNPDYLKTIQR